MKILDMLLGRPEHGVTESAVLAANATTKPSAGWAKAVDAAGTFVGFKYVCEKCGSDFLLQGIRIMRTGVHDCQCGHHADIEEWMSANGLTEEKLPNTIARCSTHRAEHPYDWRRVRRRDYLRTRQARFGWLAEMKRSPSVAIPSSRIEYDHERAHDESPTGVIRKGRG